MKINSNHMDINCDLGEGDCQQDCDSDRLLMRYISSCNIACAGHAGNDLTIKLSVENALLNQLKIGAHPGYPDKPNFGRQTMVMTDDALEKSIGLQIDLLQKELKCQSSKLAHIKFHGALYNDIEDNFQLAAKIAKYCKTHYPQVPLLGLANGQLQAACKNVSLNFISEGFMDRVYLSCGKLTPRCQQNSLINEPDIAIKQALALAQNTPISTSDGGKLKIKVDSICLHGDNPQAPMIASGLAHAFNKAGIQISRGS